MPRQQMVDTMVKSREYSNYKGRIKKKSFTGKSKLVNIAGIVVYLTLKYIRSIT